MPCLNPHSMDSSAFYKSRRAQICAQADDIARQHFSESDVLIIPSQPAPCAAGFALSLCRSAAKKIAEAAFAEGWSSGCESMDKEQSGRLHESADRQQQRGEGGA